MVSLAESHPLSLTLPPNLSQETLIPLAAILLEYPVAYVPASSDQANFLGGVPLNVFSCGLTSAFAEHVLMKFSCPSDVGLQAENLSPTKLMEGLMDRFQERLDLIGAGWVLSLEYHKETHDRVAL